MGKVVSRAANRKHQTVGSRKTKTTGDLRRDTAPLGRIVRGRIRSPGQIVIAESVDREMPITEQREQKRADDWKQAKESGIAKFDFVRDNGYSSEDFQRLLNRVRKRK